MGVAVHSLSTTPGLTHAILVSESLPSAGP